MTKMALKVFRNVTRSQEYQKEYFLSDFFISEGIEKEFGIEKFLQLSNLIKSLMCRISSIYTYD